MARRFTDVELLKELEQTAEEYLNRHLAASVEWHPHDYVPWDDGRNFLARWVATTGPGAVATR